MCTIQAFAQNRTVTGRVTDDKGGPVANASVKVKGTPIGTVIGLDGAFSSLIPPNAKSLVISSLNFGLEEVAIGTQSQINITLKAVIDNLEEVVVVG